MKKILLILLVASLAGCVPKSLFTMSVGKQTRQAIKLVRDEKKAAVQILDTTLKLYPEFSQRTTVVKRDSVLIPQVETRTEFKDRPVVDSVALKNLINHQLNTLDSLKFLIADRDMTNRILTRKAMEFINAGGLITRDTLVADTLGIRLKVYVVKNTLIAEVRQAEKKIGYDKQVDQTDIHPAYIYRDWWSFIETWISVGLNVLFLVVILIVATKTNRRT